MTFRAIFVCTGNQCRGPTGEVALRAAAPDMPLRVESYGTMAPLGAPMPEAALEALASLGLDGTRHASKPLEGAPLDGADLVLCFERHHEQAALDQGADPDRCFLLRSFARLLDEYDPEPVGAPEERARSRVEAAAEQTTYRPSYIPGDEIADPITGPPWAYVDTAKDIKYLCEEVARGLFRDEQAQR